MKNYILPSLIILSVIGLMVLGGWLLFGRDPLVNELVKLTPYSKEEIIFLKEQGFLDELETRGVLKNKEEVLSLIKPVTLIEQNLNSENESFEVLATKLDKTNYQLAFKLENKSDEKKEFYLVPISKNNQAEFQEIKGVINNKNILSINKEDVRKEPLETLYDIQQHKRELSPELAKAYDDIDSNNYQAKPIKITLDANSTLLAKSQWEIVGVGLPNPKNKGTETAPLQPVYLLVYGSAGGAKDELTILTVHSHPQQGENWEVEFTTKGTNDLKIIPNDQATIDDDEFTGLFCGDAKMNPQILEGDIIYYPNWHCGQTAKVVHYTKKAGNHALRFEFGSQTAYAYNWYSGNWLYRKKITIQADQVDADLTNFPLYVYLDPSGAGSGLGSKIRDDGYDIRFTQSDGDTELYYERESYSEADGNSTGYFWVKTNVADGVGESATDIYMYYGYADATDGSDPENTFATADNVQGTWHMDEDAWNTTPGEVIDSTSNSNDGTAAGNATTTATNAKIYRSGTFDGTGDYVNVGDSNSLDVGDIFTLTAWIKVVVGSGSVIMSKNTNGYDLSYSLDTANVISAAKANVAFIVSSTTGITDTNWHYVAWTKSGSTNRLYIDGLNVTGTVSNQTIQNNTDALQIGAAGGALSFNGSIDNAMIFNRALGAEEIKFQYYNQDSTASGGDYELTWGSEESGNTAPTITSVSDYPDPIETGNTITFSVDWNDADTEGIKMLICKTDAITAATPACPGEEWCSDKNDYDLTDPITCTYTTQAGDAGSKNYYVFVCDDSSECSSSTSGAFTVGAVSTPSIKFPGGLHFKGGTIFK